MISGTYVETEASKLSSPVSCSIPASKPSTAFVADIRMWGVCALFPRAYHKVRPDPFGRQGRFHRERVWKHVRGRYRASRRYDQAHRLQQLRLEGAFARSRDRPLDHVVRNGGAAPWSRGGPNAAKGLLRDPLATDDMARRHRLATVDYLRRSHIPSNRDAPLFAHIGGYVSASVTISRKPWNQPDPR